MAPLSPFLPTDPSQLTPLPPPLPVNPLELLSDAQLLEVQSDLILICGRNKSVMKEKHRGYVCFLARIVTAERARREQAL